MPIVVRIDVELARRKLSVGEFAEQVGLTPANVAVLKNGRAKAVRFSTLENDVPGARLPAGRPPRVGRGVNRHPQVRLRDAHEMSPNPGVVAVRPASPVAR